MKDNNNFVSIVQELQDELNLLYLAMLKDDILKKLLPTHCYILHLLYENEVENQKRSNEEKVNFKIIDIANKLHKSKAVVSAVCKTLLRKKYLNCFKDCHDGRAKNITLTPKGIEEGKEIFKFWNEASEIMAQGLTEREKLDFQILLNKVVANSIKYREKLKSEK